METDRNKYVLKRDLDDDSDGAHLASLGIEIQTEEEAKKRAITKCCLTVCRSIEKRHGVLAGASVAGVI